MKPCIIDELSGELEENPPGFNHGQTNEIIMANARGSSPSLFGFTVGSMAKPGRCGSPTKNKVLVSFWRSFTGVSVVVKPLLILVLRNDTVVRKKMRIKLDHGMER